VSLLKWIGNIAIVIGLWKIGDKWRHAFLFSIAGETAWIIAALHSQDYALATICTIFNIMAFRNWIKWGKSEP
jgi:hypothetical protein